MSKHSSIVGGSTAGRLLNCPGSYQALLALPASVDVPSEYADEGIAMHAVMARLMHQRKVAPGLASCAPDYWLGQTFYDRVLTQAHVDELIQPALGSLYTLEGKYAEGGPFEVVGIEVSGAFPGVPGAFGSCDLVLQNDRYLLLVDWKFGGGVMVPAFKRAEDGGEWVNPQLLFYGTALLATARHLFKNKRELVVAIIQPRAETALSETPVTRKELKWFAEDLKKAVVAAIGRDPERHKGEHCRFAPCKVDCPLWTGPLIDLSILQPSMRANLQRTAPVAREVTPYAEYLAHAKVLADMAAMFKKEVDEQLHAYLEDGGTVPGWRLKAKVKDRKWVDEVTVAAELQKLGFLPDEIWQYKLTTFAAADAAARRRKVKIPDELRVAPPSNETTVCPVDDPAPVVERTLVIEQFRESLKALKKG